MKSQFAMVQAVLGGIGAVSLLVAAIGIANTMMMSIYERTKEIGVMKVIGLQPEEHPSAVSAGGGLYRFCGRNRGEHPEPDPVRSDQFCGLRGEHGCERKSFLYSGLADPFFLGFAVLVGMAAGYFPAVRAMKLSPLAAIRK